MPDRRNKYFSQIDHTVLISVLFLVILGIGIVYSATSFRAEKLYGNSARYFFAQLFRVLIGLSLLLFFAVKDYHVVLKYARPFFWACFGLLILLIVPGSPVVFEQNGALSWLRLGPIRFQPSDFARYALIFYLAAVLSAKQAELDDFFNGYIKYFGLILAVVIPVALQKDLGTAALISIIALFIFYFAEAKIGYLMASGLTCFTAGLGIAFIFPHLRSRIIEFGFGGNILSTENLGYQIKQALISLAQGGLFGQGPGLSRQKYFLPEAHNDFVFAMLGEEYGLIGTVGVLIFFIIIIRRGIIISRGASDASGRLLAGGITACIASYALINIGVNINILPTTGIPLPFLSYGGSALVSHLAAIGILLNISVKSSPAHANGPGLRVYNERLKERSFKETILVFGRKPSAKRYQPIIRTRLR